MTVGHEVGIYIYTNLYIYIYTEGYIYIGVYMAAD